jgi:uncharacterized protein (TIGR02444 family)
MSAPSQDGAAPDLWRFSTAIYGRPGVKAACLTLQDAGLDVNVALWIVWLGVTGRDPGPALGQALALSALWRARVVQPLRQARDGLKPAPDFIASGAAEALRKQILAAELEGERLQQAALNRLAAACPDHGRDDPAALCRDRMAAYAAREQARAPTADFVKTVFEALKIV